MWRAVEKADVVFHAGDWVSLDFFTELESRCARLIGVWGNNDGPELRSRLPEVANTMIEGVRFSMIHETGAATGRESRADVAFPDSDALVFGHSHIPWDSVSPRGLRLLNPGSPTDRRRQPRCTFMTLEVAEGGIRDSVLHNVENRDR